MFYITEELITIIMWSILLLNTVAFFTLGERKLMGAVQRRKGPDVVGWWGTLQAFADGAKAILKEMIIPRKSNMFLFYYGPIVVFVLSLLGWVVIPLSDTSWLTSFHLAMMITLIFGSLSVYGIIMAGWSSNSRYAFLGGVRATAQMISYELLLWTVNISVAFFAGSFNYVEIVYTQRAISFFFPLVPIFLIYLICMLAETNRTPFDLAEAEAELVAGYNVEYSSIIFAMFFLGEYANMILLSVICVLYFFSGWLFIGVLHSSFFFILKVIFFCIFFVWVRATLPRFRYDQLMEFGWKHLLPFSFGMLLFFFSSFLVFGFKVQAADLLVTSQTVYALLSQQLMFYIDILEGLSMDTALYFMLFLDNSLFYDFNINCYDFISMGSFFMCNKKNVILQKINQFWRRLCNNRFQILSDIFYNRFKNSSNTLYNRFKNSSKYIILWAGMPFSIMTGQVQALYRAFNVNIPVKNVDYEQMFDHSTPIFIGGQWDSAQITSFFNPQNVPVMQNFPLTQMVFREPPIIPDVQNIIIDPQPPIIPDVQNIIIDPQPPIIPDVQNIIIDPQPPIIPDVQNMDYLARCILGDRAQLNIPPITDDLMLPLLEAPLSDLGPLPYVVIGGMKLALILPYLKPILSCLSDGNLRHLVLDYYFLGQLFYTCIDARILVDSLATSQDLAQLATASENLMTSRSQLTEATGRIYSNMQYIYNTTHDLNLNQQNLTNSIIKRTRTVVEIIASNRSPIQNIPKEAIGILSDLRKPLDVMVPTMSVGSNIFFNISPYVGFQLTHIFQIVASRHFTDSLETLNLEVPELVKMVTFVIQDLLHFEYLQQTRFSAEDLEEKYKAVVRARQGVWNGLNRLRDLNVFYSTLIEHLTETVNSLSVDVVKVEKSRSLLTSLENSLIPDFIQNTKDLQSVYMSDFLVRKHWANLAYPEKQHDLFRIVFKIP